MSSRERILTASTSTEGTSTTTCSSTSGSRSTPAEDDRVDDDFVVVELMDVILQEEPERRWSCSLPRVKFYTSDPKEKVDIAMGESGLAASEPLTVGEIMQRVVVRVPLHVALRYKTGGRWRDITYRDYYIQCITAAKSFIKVGTIVLGAIVL